MPSGKTKAMMEIRTMAALMQKIYTMDLSEEVKDKLWTLTVYFNSLDVYKRQGHVTTEILVKICAALDCGIEDIVEVVPDNKKNI